MTTAWLKVKLVGENAARDGLSLELGGRAWVEALVEMGVTPRRELCRLPLLFHADGGGALVLRMPEDEVVGLLGRGGSLEGGKLIGTARTSRRLLADCIDVLQ